MAFTICFFVHQGGNMSERKHKTVVDYCHDGLSDQHIFANAFRYASIGMALVGPDGTWLKVNNALCSMLGYTSRELLSKKFQDITHPEDLEEDLVYVNRVLAGAIDTYQMEKRYFHRDGHIIDVLLSVSLVKESDGTPQFFISQIQDITRRKQAEQELLLVSQQDPLTKVANRRFFMEHATRELTRGKRFHEPQAILIIDIDHFKTINDKHGHDVGDEVLKAMATACSKALREVDVFGRIGGEEFAAMLLNTNDSVARIVAERVRESVERLSVNVGGKEIPFTISIGLVSFLGGSNTLDDRMKMADKALYRAKESGRNRVEVLVDVVEPSGVVPERLRSTFVRFEWEGAYESGNQLIDSQHMHLFALANDLLSALITGLPDSQVEAAAVALINHTEQHFRDEEKIFCAAGYPKAQEHTAIHKQLIREMHSILKSFTKGQETVGGFFTFLAHDVVLNHLLTEDRKFFSLLREP
ncbi:MAG: diguanylate cyclase [Proteobacteria bacterium]|nr:diguanylate cyclase [Pseudodesulfovibrio sp.]MBU4514714.1 diguanylate cyclase [Pseudomonadota bacterium]